MLSGLEKVLVLVGWCGLDYTAMTDFTKVGLCVAASSRSPRVKWKRLKPSTTTSLPPFSLSLFLAFPFPARLVATKMFQPSNIRPIIQTHAGEREGIFALASDASALKISRVFGNHSGARVPAADSSRIPRGAPSHGVNSEGCWQHVGRCQSRQPGVKGQRRSFLSLPSLHLQMVLPAGRRPRPREKRDLFQRSLSTPFLR